MNHLRPRQALSILLPLACLVLALVWIRSYHRDDGIIFTEEHGRFIRIVSFPGEIDFTFSHASDGDEAATRENGIDHATWVAQPLDGAMAEDWGMPLGTDGHLGFCYQYSDYYYLGFIRFSRR